MAYGLDPTLQTSEVGGGIDPSTGSTMGEIMAKNSTNQALQEQLVAQAVEKTKQAHLQTSTEEGGGLAAERGLVPKAQAISTLKIALKSNGASDEDIKSAMKETEDWPDVVSSAVVDRLVWSLRPKTVNRIGEGAAYPASGTESDNDGNPIPKGTMIQEVVDNEGNTTYLHSAAPQSGGSGGGKGGGKNDDAEWIKLGSQIQRAILGRMGVVGQVGQTVTRSDRAINTITHSNGPDGMLTKQDIENISTDIAAIYQGGVPGITQIVENSYGTSLTNVVDTLRHYTGILAHIGNKQVLEESKKKLMLVLTDMRNSALAQMGKFVEMQFPFYKSMITADPGRWEEVKQSVQAFMSSGLLNVSGQVMPPSGAPPMAPAGANTSPSGTPAHDPLGLGI